MLLIFRRSYLGCWGGDGWGLPIVVNVLCSSGSKWLNHWTKKRKWNVPFVSQWLFFFLTIQKSRALHPESPSLWPGTKHLKGWGHRGEDEVAALRGVDCYLPPLSEIHLCAGKQSSEKLVRWWFWVIVSLSFQISNFKSQPLCGSRLSSYMSRVSSPALISDSTISAPDEQCVCERESGSVCVDSISSLKNWLSVF